MRNDKQSNSDFWMDSCSTVFTDTEKACLTSHPDTARDSSNPTQKAEACLTNKTGLKTGFGLLIAYCLGQPVSTMI